MQKNLSLVFAVPVRDFTTTFSVTAFYSPPSLMCDEVEEVNYSGLAQSQP